MLGSFFTIARSRAPLLEGAETGEAVGARPDDDGDADGVGAVTGLGVPEDAEDGLRVRPPEAQLRPVLE